MDGTPVLQTFGDRPGGGGRWLGRRHRVPRFLSLEILVAEEQGPAGLLHGPSDRGGEPAEEDARADAVGQAMVDEPYPEADGLEAAEGASPMAQPLVAFAPNSSVTAPKIA